VVLGKLFLDVFVASDMVVVDVQSQEGWPGDVGMEEAMGSLNTSPQYTMTTAQILLNTNHRTVTAFG
jgi:hypothetical protein